MFEVQPGHTKLFSHIVALLHGEQDAFDEGVFRFAQNNLFPKVRPNSGMEEVEDQSYNLMLKLKDIAPAFGLPNLTFALGNYKAKKTTPYASVAINDPEGNRIEVWFSNQAPFAAFKLLKGTSEPAGNIQFYEKPKEQKSSKPEAPVASKGKAKFREARNREPVSDGPRFRKVQKAKPQKRDESPRRKGRPDAPAPTPDQSAALARQFYEEEIRQRWTDTGKRIMKEKKSYGVGKKKPKPYSRVSKSNLPSSMNMSGYRAHVAAKYGH